MARRQRDDHAGGPDAILSRLAKAAGSIDDAAPIAGSRHGHRASTLTGTFGKTEIAVSHGRPPSTTRRMRRIKRPKNLAKNTPIEISAILRHLI
jgi:hypothetical protein